METIITIKGMHCNSCKLLIEDVIKENPNVVSCSIDFKTGKAVVKHNKPLNKERIRKEIESLGEYKIEFLKQ
ncbi:heavy-metal-associated domain-containing protein [Candidatus Pacearchaeota archaeon]|nr:heavy-metal-associated domain-containing protein [Candidatus Pacearchaeota archaeon]